MQFLSGLNAKTMFNYQHNLKGNFKRVASNFGKKYYAVHLDLSIFFSQNATQEKPAHQVKVKVTPWLLDFFVTQAQPRAFLEESGGW